MGCAYPAVLVLQEVADLFSFLANRMEASWRRSPSCDWLTDRGWSDGAGEIDEGGAAEIIQGDFRRGAITGHADFSFFCCKNRSELRAAGGTRYRDHH